MSRISSGSFPLMSYCSLHLSFILANFKRDSPNGGQRQSPNLTFSKLGNLNRRDLISTTICVPDPAHVDSLCPGDGQGPNPMPTCGQREGLALPRGGERKTVLAKAGAPWFSIPVCLLRSGALSPRPQPTLGLARRMVFKQK